MDVYINTVSTDLREIKVNTFHAEGGRWPLNVWWDQTRTRRILVCAEKCETSSAELGRDKGSYRQLPAHSIHHGPNNYQHFPDSVLAVDIQKTQTNEGA